MTLGQEIEHVRHKQKIPVFVMCDIFNTDESGYYQITTDQQHPTVYELILFIDVTHHPLQSI